jgi:diaminopimelate decarboxylase
MEMKRRDFIKLTASAAFAAGVIGTDIFTLEAAEKDSEFFRADFSSGAGFVNFSDSQAYVAGYPVSWWEQHYGMPLHVQYAGQIRGNIRAYLQVFHELYRNSEIRYAAKACTHPGVFRVLDQEGAGADVASDNEARSALDGGINPKRIDVNGNAKSDELISSAIVHDMLLIANDIEEFLMISEMASAIGKTPRVMLRISGLNGGASVNAQITTAGPWTKFGCSLNDIPVFFEILKKEHKLRFMGFHVHIGSQVTRPEPFLFAAGKLIELSKSLKAAGQECSIINIGGGFPVSYLTKEQWEYITERILHGHLKSLEGDKSALWTWAGALGGFSVSGKGKEKVMNFYGKEYYCEYAKENMLKTILTGSISVEGKTMNMVSALREIGEPTLIIEPGRSIVEDSGVTLAKVLRTRRLDGMHNMTTVNMGETNFASAMSGMPFNRWSLATELNVSDGQPFETFIAGQLCFSSDMLTKSKVELQHKPKKGEILIVYCTGAYNSQFFAANTNSFPRPSRVLVMENGSIEYIKKSDTYEQMFSL